MLNIVAKLWAAIYDLLFYIKGESHKSMDQIQEELDMIEYMCRPYADADDLTEYATMKEVSNYDEFVSGDG